jgi:hypothetical protein
MKRVLDVSAIIVVSLLLWPAAAGAQNTATVTGAGTGKFGNGPAVLGVRLQTVEFGQGVVIRPDGTATGDFEGRLLGLSVLGVPQTLTVEGKVISGAVLARGSVTFTGTASVALNGTPLLSGVTVRITTTSQGLQVNLGATALPSVRLTAGGLTID